MIKTNKKIQRLVDKRKGSSIAHVAFTHIAAVGLADEKRTSTLDGAHHDGVEVGLVMFLAYEKKLERTLFLASERKKNGDFGIYVATQETSDGVDRLYFIGTPGGICAALEKIPEDA